LIFLFLVTLLGALTAGGLTVRGVIHNTDANLRRRMPTIMMVQPSTAFYTETGEWSLEEQPILTPEMIREIADLDIVAFFDYAIDVGHWSVTSRELEPWSSDEVFWPFMQSHHEEFGVYLRPRGVSSPAFIEARDGLIDLVAGRTFTEEELSVRSEVVPVMISSELARINGLEINDTFDSRLVILAEDSEGSGLPEDSEEEEPSFIVDESFPMQVIGLFESDLPAITADMDPDTGFPIFMQVGAMHHRVYLPNIVAEEMFNLRVYGEAWMENDDKPFIHHFFTLADPMYHADFVQAVAQLDGDWEVVDLSTGFQELATSMVNMREIADIILTGSVIAMVLIISLLVLLFLRDRKHEIGVYLAMGDKKSNIIKQMVLELLPLAVIGLTLALFIGNLASGAMSRTMLRQDLAANPPTQESVQAGGPLENLGYRFRTTHEEMFESFEISSDGVTVFAFYSIGLTTVLVATFIPILATVNVDPKTLLLEDQGQ